MIRLAIAIGVILIPGTVGAHPDHVSGAEFGLAHYLTDPFHFLLPFAALVLFLAAWRRLRWPLVVRERR